MRFLFVLLFVVVGNVWGHETTTPITSETVTLPVEAASIPTSQFYAPPSTYQVLNDDQCLLLPEHKNFNAKPYLLNCPAHQIISDIPFISWGLPNKDNCTVNPQCHGDKSIDLIKSCVGQPLCGLVLDRSSWGTPCSSDSFYLLIRYSCSSLYNHSYEMTQDWFGRAWINWIPHVHHLIYPMTPFMQYVINQAGVPITPHDPSQPQHILEVGAFEGGTTVWLIENMLHHPDSTLTAIDLFDASNQVDDTVYNTLGVKWKNVDQRFIHNVLTTGRSPQVHIMKSYSDQALLELRAWRRYHEYYHLIYIDASHIAKDVLSDAVLSWPMLRPGGIMIFDDYEWKITGFDKPWQRPHLAIDSFIGCYQDEIEVLHKQYQMIIRKKMKTQ